MAESTPATTPSLSQRMETLAALEPSPFPVISLYLSLTPNQNGREATISSCGRSSASARRRCPPNRRSARASRRMRSASRQYLDSEKDARRGRDSRSSRAPARSCSRRSRSKRRSTITGCSSARSPHLYPLAKLVETYPRYAAVTLDTNKARIQVFSLATAEPHEQVVSDKTRRTSKGGWSQARYQRRADNMHMQPHEGSRRHARQGRA